MMVQLGPDSRDYLMPGIQALLSAGWSLVRIPHTAKLPTNRLKLTLQTDNAEYRYRLLVYAVGSSSRGRPDERRVEITSTYVGGNLADDKSVKDIVLGWDRTHHVYVGIDGRRLSEGGNTHNASTFVTPTGIERAPSPGGILIMPRASSLFTIEYQAYFRPPSLAEYLMNVNRIHRGLYSPPAQRSSPVQKPVLVVSDEKSRGDEVIIASAGSVRDEPPADAPDVEAAEAGRMLPRKTTPEEFDRILKRAAENGLLGEEHVFAEEKKRLFKCGRADLAAEVCWVSLESVAEGYDILSYEADGTERYVEVKSTQGKSQAFPITLNEWRIAESRKSKYIIARVTSVRESPEILFLRDPARLRADGTLVLEAAGWKVIYE